MPRSALGFQEPDRRAQVDIVLHHHVSSGVDGAIDPLDRDGLLLFDAMEQSPRQLIC
jgi:hypothetical protein